MFDINGQIHLGHHGRIVLPALPDNLVAKPTLVWLLRSAADRAQRVEASYLTGGITWKSDYVMIINAADTRADVTGWVTIDNKSGATYGNAALKLVAGDVNRAADRRREGRVMELAAKAAAPAAARQDFAAEGFFEYHLYTLDGRTTIKDNQTKQLTADVGQRRHRSTSSSSTTAPRSTTATPTACRCPSRRSAVFFDVQNSKDNRLGVPLPKGKVRVYKADRSGSQQFIGEDWIEHTPKDEKIRIKMGNAFDVVADRTQKDWKKLGGNLYETEWEISLRNHKSEAADGHGDGARARRLAGALQHAQGREGRGPHPALRRARAQGGRGQAPLPRPHQGLTLTVVFVAAAPDPRGGDDTTRARHVGRGARRGWVARAGLVRALMASRRRR